MSHTIEPTLGQKAPIFITDYPATQAALAKLNKDTPHIAERFELYIQGQEIANGFHELNDTTEQAARFHQDQRARAQQGNPPMDPDPLFLACLDHLPDCSDVALGIDRLMMLALNRDDIREVISFHWDQ